MSRFVSGLLVLILWCALLAGCSSSALPAGSPSSSLRSFDSLDELSNALGFDMVKLDGGGFQAFQYASIDDAIGQIEYHRDDAVLLVRMAGAEEQDITGVGQVEYTTTDHGNAQLHIGSFKDVQAAWIVSGDYVYAMSATGISVEDFQALAGQLADAVAAG